MEEENQIDENDSSFREYRLMLLYQIKACQKGIEKLDDKVDKTRGEMHKQLSKIGMDIAMLKVKSGVWGAIAGLIPALCVAVYLFLKESKTG